jgi:hypothetical protein
MSRRRKLILVGVLVVAASAAATIATRTVASQKGALARLSNEGRHVAVQRGPIVGAVRVQHSALLAVRGGRAFYRLETAKGPCVGSGPSADIGEIGAVECPDGPFPTAQRPVLDLSIYESTNHERHEVSLFRIEGVAADGVAEIAFLRPNGRVAVTVPVRGNVFAATSVPGGPIAGLAALGTDGAEVWRSP